MFPTLPKKEAKFSSKTISSTHNRCEIIILKTKMSKIIFRKKKKYGASHILPEQNTLAKSTMTKEMDWELSFTSTEASTTAIGYKTKWMDLVPSTIPTEKSPMKVSGKWTIFMAKERYLMTKSPLLTIIITTKIVRISTISG